VLVGDPQQLPATVLSKRSMALAFDRSLFERLQLARWPVHMLRVQYRMHPQIRAFPSAHFYGNSLAARSFVLLFRFRFKCRCLLVLEVLRDWPDVALGACFACAFADLVAHGCSCVPSCERNARSARILLNVSPITHLARGTQASAWHVMLAHTRTTSLVRSTLMDTPSLRCKHHRHLQDGTPNAARQPLASYLAPLKS
jgi:AAA domain